MAKNSSTRDIEISAITIVNSAGKTYGLKDFGFNLLNIYEDIFSPVTTGTIQIVDAIDLYSQLELHGHEYIRISFQKPNDNTQQTRYTKTFRIYKASNKKPSKSLAQEYVLHFCSEEKIFSNQQTISRAYKGKSVTDYVYSICRDNLKIRRVSKLDLLNNFEYAIGIQDVTITRNYPLDVIEYFASIAFNEYDSPFLFFENRDGFNFLSLSGMFSRDAIITLNYSNAKMTEKETSAAFVNANQITNFEFKNSFDMMKATQDLTYSGKLYTLDLVRQKYQKYEFSAAKLNKKNFIDGGNLPINNAKNRNGKSVLQEYDSNVNFTLTNKEQTNIPKAISKAYRVNDTNIERTLLQRQSQLNMLKNTSVDVIVAGNAMFSVGYVVDVNLPAFAKSASSERNLDPYYSGKYLITKTRHVITPSGGHQTILTLAKNSVSSTFDFVSGTNQDYKKAQDL